VLRRAMRAAAPPSLLLLALLVACAAASAAAQGRCSAGDKACFCRSFGGEWRPAEKVLPAACRIFYEHQGGPCPQGLVLWHCFQGAQVQQLLLAAVHCAQRPCQAVTSRSAHTHTTSGNHHSSGHLATAAHAHATAAPREAHHTGPHGAGHAALSCFFCT
jgi:hypothetical protein